MQKLLDFIYVLFFGKYTLEGFVNVKKEQAKKYNYVIDSVFPDEETMKIALTTKSTVIPK